MHTTTQEAQEPTKWPPDGWLTKKQAAERLGLSESRIAAMGGDDRDIHIIMSRNPESNQKVTLFHSGDVERIAFERENPAQASKVPAKLDKPIVASPHYAEKFYGVSPVSPKPWITISEAADYTGLPASILAKLVESGALPAIDCGPRVGGKWRIKRTDLDKLEGSL